MDQDQLNLYVANEGYVVRVPHNPLDPYSISISMSLEFFAVPLIESVLTATQDLE